ncbi:MAG: flippase [Candidatus Hadarchaeota archaeon]
MVEHKPSVGDHYARRFFKEGAIVFAALAASAVTAFFFRIILARNLGPTDYGLFYYVLAFVLIVGTVRDFGIGQAVVRYIPEFMHKKQHGKLKSSIVFYAVVQIAYSTVLALVLVVFADQIAASFIEAQAAAWILRMLAGWFLFEAIFTVFKTVFQGFREMTPFSVLGFLEVFLPFVFFIFVMILLGSSAANVALAYMIGLAVTSVIALGIFFKKHSEILKTKTEISKPLVKDMFKFSIPIVIGGIMGAIFGQMNTLFIGKIRTPAEAGLYQVAYPISDLLAYFPMAIGIVLFPMASELWAKREHGLLGQAMTTLMKFSFIAIVPLALIMIAFPNIVISLIFGQEYVAASTALQILVISMVIGAVLVVPKRALLGMGQSRIHTIILSLRGFLAFSLSLLFIPIYGIEGAAVATLFSTLVALSLSVYFARKFVKTKFPFLAIGKTIIGSLIILLLVVVLKAAIDLHPLLEFFVVMAPCLFFYVVWVLFSRTLELSDLQLLKKTVPVPKLLINILKKFVR